MVEPDQNKLRRYLAFSTIGLEMGLSAALGLVIGMALDRWLDTKPWLMILFLFFGFVAGFRRLFGLAREYLKENTSNHEQ